ncbi:hypothetical protein [Williamsia phyllosphaerae]|uniref:hypothetical protein n=1 Tax=Williamsia phyllosphaerae TaxID=885042 RepID=UPI0016656314|nr:hypothetical protein [Williamsia phyllosphaerae]
MTDMCPGFYVSELPWSASYGVVPLPFGQSFAASVAQGELLLRRELDNNGPAIILGYSGGAAVAGNVADQGHRNIIAVGLIADPFQPESVTRNGKFGVAGSREIRNTKHVKWVWNPRDMICQADRNSPIRTVADATARMSLKNPDEWKNDLLTRITKRKWQEIRRHPLDFRALVADALQAKEDVESYLDGAQHQTAYYNRRADLAHWVMTQ